MKQDAYVSDIDGDQTSQLRLPRVSLDLKIPLWGVVTAAALFTWAQVTMLFEQRETTKQVSAMQVSLQAQTASQMQMAADQALLKYRVEKIEAERGPVPAVVRGGTR